MSAVTTREVPPALRANRRPPATERTEAPRSNAGTESGSRRAACTVVALVLSTYGVATVANTRESGTTSVAFKVSREASTPMVVASSS
jgi:hypothetical protein